MNILFYIVIPSFQLCKEHKFGDIEDFYKSKQKYEKLHIADSKERATIEYLIQNTWNHHIVGIGKDAVNLRHKSIQVSHWLDSCT